eukprot:jgi/Ulvmu1/11942/UM082_0021.1
MASDLAAQLQSLAAKAGVAPRRTKGQPSLLYDSQAAADIGLDDVYDKAVEGFDALLELDAQLGRFAATILDRASLSYDRSASTKVENDTIDTDVHFLCVCLVPHFLTQAATTVLEYLVRKYRIHEVNVGKVLACFAPYHATAEFARLVQISTISGTVFHFLEGTKNTGAVVPRTAIVKRCLKDHALFNQLCAATITAHERGALCRVSASFHTALVCETLQAAAPPPDTLLQATIPHLLPGLTPSAHPHLRAASLAAAACMCACTTLAAPVIAALVTDACRHVTAATVRETLLFVAHALASQPALRRPPPRAVAALLRMPELPHEVSAARRSGLRVAAAAVELVCNAPALLEEAAVAGDAPLVPPEDVPAVRAAAVQLVHGMHVQDGGVSAAELCRRAALALRHAASDAAVALATEIVQELKLLPECSEALEEAVRKAGESASIAAKQHLHAAMVGGGSVALRGLPVGSELSAALEAPLDSTEFSNAVAALQQLKDEDALDARMHARVADAVQTALSSVDAKVVADGVRSPLLGLLPAVEVVPELLRCLQGVTRRFLKPLGASAVSDMSGVGGELVGCMLWHAEHAVVVALGCLEAVCGACKGKPEWENTVVAMVLPWFLVPQEWPPAALAEVATVLGRLGAWRAVFGEGVAPALRAAAAAREPVEEAAGGAADAGEAAVADGDAAAAGSKKKRKKTRKSGGGAGGGAERPVGARDAWVREWWQARGTSGAGVALTPVAALSALQRAFSAAGADAGEAFGGWQAMAEVARASGLAGRHVATVVAAAQACVDHVEASAAGGACARWLVMQLCDSAAAGVLREGASAWQKGSDVADRSGGLLEGYGGMLKRSLPLAHAALLQNVVHSLLLRHSSDVLWRCVLSSLSAAHLRTVLSLPVPLFYKLPQRLLAAIDAVARAHPDTAAPPAIALLCSVISRRRAASEEDDDADAEQDPAVRALQILPKTVEAAADPDAAALTVAPFVVACMAASAQPVRAAAVDAIAALQAPLATAAADLSPFVALIAGERAAIMAAPDALAGVLAAAELPDAARASVTQHILKRPLTLASDPAAMPPASDTSSTLPPGVAGSSSLADVGFEVGLPAAAVHDAHAVLAVHGAEAARFFAAAAAAVQPEAEVAPALQAVPAYVSREGLRLLREGHAAGELVGLVRDALRAMGSAAAEATRTTAVASVRVILSATAALTADPGGGSGAAPRTEHIASTLRLHAVEDVLAVLWPSSSEAQHAMLVPPLLACAASDPSAACRAAAQRVVQTLRLPLAALCRPLRELNGCAAALLAAEDAAVAEAVLGAVSATATGAAKRRRVSSGSSRKSMESSDGETGAAAGANTADSSASAEERMHEEAAELLRSAARRGQSKKKAFVGLLGIDVVEADTAVRTVVQVLREVKAVAVQHADGGDAVIAEETRKVVWGRAVDAATPVLEMLQWREVALVEGEPADADMAHADMAADADLAPADVADAAETAGKDGAKTGKRKGKKKRGKRKRAGATKGAAVGDGVTDGALRLNATGLLQLLASVQAGLHACSSLLAEPAAFSPDTSGDAAGDGPDVSAVADLAPRVNYAAALALAAVQRVGAAAPPAVLAAAVPLGEAVEIVARTQAAVPRGREAALRVIVLALRGAALPDITHALPAVMSLALSGGRKASSSSQDTACMAIGAAAAAWRATGGKRYKFLSALLRRLSHAPAGLRPQLTAAAVGPLTGRGKAHASLFSLARATIAFQLSLRGQSDPSEDRDADGSDASPRLSAAEAGAVLSGTFARFPWPVRLTALQRLLESFVEPEEMDTGGKKCVAFVAAEVAALKGAKGGLEDAAVQGALKDVLQAAMQMLTAASEGAPGAVEDEAQQRARSTRRAVAKSLRLLLEGLCETMHPAPLFAALQSATEGGADRTARAALRTFTASATGLRRPLDSATADAAVSMAAHAARIAAPGADADAEAGAATRQAAALAVDAAAAAAAGTAAAAGLAQCAPPLAACAADAAAGAAARAGALGALARVVYAAGPTAVPHMPAAAAAVLGRAEACLAAASGEAGAEIELSGTLAALRSFIATLPGIFSPYLPRALAVLYHPAALAASNALCRAAASEARAAIPAAVEFRLLLPALTQQVAAAESSGTAALVATMDLLREALEKMNVAEAAPHVSAVAEMVLGVLDIRGRAAEGIAVADVEAAACKAMVALVMKLSESRFKPLFADLAEWGGNLPAYAAAIADDAERAAAATARRCAWLALVSRLSHALRSVFTPYFQNVLDTMCDSLAAEPALVAPSRKKQKASKAAGAAPAASAAEGSGHDANQEVLRERAVACIHRCCMHDAQGFVTPDRFERFLAPLLARLAEPAAQQATAGGASAAEDADLVAGLELGKRTRLPRSTAAAAAALVQLAVTAHNDAAVKRLNHQVMLLTRSEAAGTRLAAVEVAANLAARLRSEFVALLPETLPFLAELLEDSAPAVAARNSELVALLEDVAGEDLQEYLRP